MVDQRIEDLYEFNIGGNFERRLKDLSKSLQGVQKRFDGLRDTATKGATFAKTSKEIKELSGASKAYQKTLRKVVGEEEKLVAANGVLAGAYNRLVREQNKLNISRQAETIALEQARKSAQPRIINARAEERALRQLSGELEKLAAERKFAQLAAEAGLQVSADGRRVFDAEAEAAKRAAKQQEKLAIARRLAARGLDPQGRAQVQGPALPDDIRRQQEAQRKFQQDLEREDINKRVRDFLERLLALQAPR